MNRSVLGVSVVALAVMCANCAGGNGPADTLTAPTGLAALSTSAGASAATESRSGGSGGKKGGGGTTAGGGSLELVLVSDINGNGQPNWGDTVTFTVVAPTVAEPTVELLCSQDATVVYGATAGFYDSYPWPWTRNMTLSSTAWSSGAATCTATLYPLGAKSSVLARVTFTAGA
jgi:hypothetical protein